MIILISAGRSARGVNYPERRDADTFSGMTADGEVGPPRQRNARGTGERLRGELIEAAVRVLAARGDTERLSIRAVAAEARVTPPAIYRCFPDRRALVRTAVETCFGRFETHLAQAEQGTADPFEALRRRCHAYVSFGASQPRLYRVMFGAWSAGPKELGTYGRRPHPGAGAFNALIASIQRCRDAGAQTRQPASFLAYQLWSLLHGLTDLRTGKPELPWPGSEDMIDHYLVCVGLRGPRRPGAY
jgi:AcrR family transcriptional regulator